MADTFDQSFNFEQLFLDADEANTEPWEDAGDITGVSSIDMLLTGLENGSVSEDQARSVLSGARTLDLGSAFDPTPFQSGGAAQTTPYSYASGSCETRPYVFAFQNHMCLDFPVRYYAPSRGQNMVTGRVVLPVTPESFEVSADNSPEEVTSMAGFTFSHAGPITMRTITMEGFFPHLKSAKHVPSYMHSNLIKQGYFYQPAQLTSKFVTSMRAGQPLMFSVYELGARNPIFYLPVIVTDFSWSIKHANGKDRFWNMTLREWSPQFMLLGSVVNKRSAPGTQRPRGNCGHSFVPQPGTNTPTRPSRGTYTTRKGDTLSKIAARYMGSAKKWETLKKMNADILKRHYKNTSIRASTPLKAGIVLRITLGR